MSLTLTTEQLRRIRDVQELMIAPLRFSSAEEWAGVVQEMVTDLFGLERSAVALPLGEDEVRFVSPNLEPSTLEAFRRLMVGPAIEKNRYRDPVLEQAMHRLVSTGVEVWNREISERLSRTRLEEMPRFYAEVVQPARFEEMLTVGCSLERGRAMLALFSEGPGQSRFGAQELSALELLLPAFKAGMRVQSLSTTRWRRLRETLDTLDEGVVIFRDGRERYRNRALRRILAEENERSRLHAEITVCAQRFTRARQSGTGAVGRMNSTGSFSTGDNRYRIAASHLEGGRDGVPPTVAVVVRPAVPALPSGSELRERYGLTEREAEVALLLARGHSNRAIAEQLDISPHTARHHAQRVLEKVGTGSRKALAMKLLQERD